MQAGVESGVSRSALCCSSLPRERRQLCKLNEDRSETPDCAEGGWCREAVGQAFNRIAVESKIEDLIVRYRGRPQACEDSSDMPLGVTLRCAAPLQTFQSDNRH